MKGTTKFGNSLRLDWWESCQGLPEEGWMSGRGRLLPPLLRLLHASLHWADGGLFLEAFSGTCQNTPLPFEKSHLNCRQRGLACCRMGSTLLISAPGWSRGTPGEVREGGMERKRPPHSLFHAAWLRCVHLNFGSERRITRGCLQNSLTDLSKSFSSKLRGIIADSSHSHLNLESVRSTEESQS